MKEVVVACYVALAPGAAGYSEKGFDSFAIGASQAEIQRVLGPPFETHHDLQDDEMWLYPPPLRRPADRDLAQEA